MHSSVSLVGFESAEKNLVAKTHKENQLEERPNPMRPRLVDTYINSVLQNKADGNERAMSGSTSENAKIAAVEQIYRLNLDNRILNNLRAQLNSMIDDEKGLVSTETFRKMFFTFFKGEKAAHQVYDMLVPCITVFYDEATGCFLEPSDPKATADRKTVRI